MSKPILIASAGSTFPDLRNDLGDFDDWIERGLDAPGKVARLDVRHCAELPDAAEYAGVVVTGSHAMVTDRLDWSERLAAWLAGAVARDIPVLGICYGHQLLAHAMGGEVGYRPQGRELGTVSIQLTGEAEADSLFRNMPTQFSGNMAHEQSVLTLPPGAVRLAHSEGEANQAFRVGSCGWGVQFHPEFSAEVMRQYVARSDAPEAANPVADTPEAAALLKAFAALRP